MIRQILEKTGVFASFLLVTVFSVFIYSPTNGSNATSTATDVTVNIGSSLAVSLSTDKVAMEGNPGDIVTSTPLTVYGYTNNYNGLAVLISDADDDTSLNHESTNDKLTTIASGLDLFSLADSSGYEVWDQYLNENMLQENQWGMKNSLSDAIIKENTGRSVDYVYPIHEYSVRSDNNPSSVPFEWQVFGGVVMASNKSNAMLVPGTYHNTPGSSLLWGVVDEDRMLHEDIYFKAHLGRSLTSGIYSDTILLTVHPRDYI